MAAGKMQRKIGHPVVTTSSAADFIIAMLRLMLSTKIFFTSSSEQAASGFALGTAAVRPLQFQQVHGWRKSRMLVVQADGVEQVGNLEAAFFKDAFMTHEVQISFYRGP